MEMAHQVFYCDICSNLWQLCEIPGMIAYASNVVSETGETLGLAGNQPSSKLHKRACLKRIWWTTKKQDTQCPLASL